MSIPQIFTATLSYLLDSGLYYSSNSMNFYCFKIMMTKMAFKNAILLRHVFQEFNRHDCVHFFSRAQEFKSTPASIKLETCIKKTNQGSYIM